MYHSKKYNDIKASDFYVSKSKINGFDIFSCSLTDKDTILMELFGVPIRIL